MDKKEILEGLEHAPYSFIANNYYKISQENLRDIILELLAMFEDTEYEKVTKGLIENLKDYRMWDEE